MGSKKDQKVLYGSKCLGFWAKFDRDSSSWRMSQQSLLSTEEEFSEEFSETWPRWGTMRNGIVSALPTSARLTGAGAGSSSDGWPTPRASDGLRDKMKRETHLKMSQRPDGGFQNLHSVVAGRQWPTPTSHNAKENASPSEYKRNTPTLAAQVGGKLNPRWVEWLMGFPLGHTSTTDFDVLGMQSFLNVRSSSDDDSKK
jgi:hypothetical protein